MNWSWSSLSALPFGLVLFAGLAFGYFRRKTGHRKAQEEYPTLATQLGLSYRAPKTALQVGQLHGEIGGYAVVVDPDDQTKIIVRFRGEPNLDVRNYESLRRPNGTENYVDPNQGINNFFKTRWTSPKIAEQFRDADLPNLLAPFQDRYRGYVKELNLTQHGVTCVLDFGHPRHIPADAVEELLPALVRLAEVVEPQLPKVKPSDVPKTLGSASLTGLAQSNTDPN